MIRSPRLEANPNSPTLQKLGILKELQAEIVWGFLRIINQKQEEIYEKMDFMVLLVFSLYWVRIFLGYASLWT
jgi:predicted nuclease of restriction endonuclease-like (RecB) superfamily